MNLNKFEKAPSITADMTILDVISMHSKTEGVFKKYGEKTGVCLCCQNLFDPLRAVADKFELDLEELLSNLKKAAKTP